MLLKYRFRKLLLLLKLKIIKYKNMCIYAYLKSQTSISAFFAFIVFSSAQAVGIPIRIGEESSTS